MLYKKNSSEKLSDELFKNPTSEYRSTPFWAWNTDLKIEELRRQIEIFKIMGFGGFHMHVRTGMSTPYLSPEFMNLITGCINKAEEENMLAWLYDEDRWPSGAAGGLVTKDEKFRGRCLLMTTEPVINGNYAKKLESRAEGSRDGNGYLLTCFDIELSDNGYLTSYRQIKENENAKGTKWYAYIKIHADSAWYNNQSYIDTLNKNAVDRFIQITHEQYKKTVGDKFDNTVPAIFTDEPQFTRKRTLKNSKDKTDIILPWTDDLPDTFKAEYGFNLIDKIPELFWETDENKISEVRYCYHDHVCERFTEAFADNVGNWCKDNNIKLTGHMMEEPTLRSQTCALGEAMRSYRSFGIPGIDMLCANFEFTTAKQCQSAVHQYGKEGMTSELYGVTGWDYDFRGYKLHGDWQACLGVTVRVPHLSWVAMGGEAKRDYPASISYQSPWWSEYSYLEDHFARVNTLMTRGKPVVKIGVIHPIESYWIHFGPDDKTKKIRDEKDKKFSELTEWLIKSSLDFDFISESLLPDQCRVGSVPFKVGEMEYDVIIVPECESLRSTTIDRLEQFSILGGNLIFMGEVPRVIDGKISNKCNDLYKNSVRIPYNKQSVINALESFRTVNIENTDGSLNSGFIYQLRKDTDGMNLFISRCCEPQNKNTSVKNKLKIIVYGEYTPIVYNTISGETEKVSFCYETGNTVIYKTLYDYDSLLIKLYDIKSEPVEKEEADTKGDIVNIPDKINYSLSENNVLLIDMCEYALDDGSYMPKEEILRLDNKCREILGWEDRGGSVPQPWSVPKEKVEHSLTLRYTFTSELIYVGAKLAMEKPEDAQIYFNGEPVNNSPVGWWTDKDIKTINLPQIKSGNNTLIVKIPFGHTTNTEWMYILGKFGVKAEGNASRITSLPDTVEFGSITQMNMPFYGGNITYDIPLKSGNYNVTINNYAGALIKISAENIDKRIVFPPYSAEVSLKNDCILHITLFGNRQNCFGPVHRTINNGWIGPNAWRTEGDEWDYNYCLKKIGIMEKPVIIRYE